MGGRGLMSVPRGTDAVTSASTWDGIGVEELEIMLTEVLFLFLNGKRRCVFESCDEMDYSPQNYSIITIAVVVADKDIRE